jgi:hypothetical protein
VGLCVAPVLGALALYGLAQRIGQYGWTIERSWAVVAWSFLMLFSLGYVWGIVRRRDAWTAELARVNTVMGIVVAVVMLLANSPVLDFRRISLASQVARVERGDIGAEALDFAYIGRNLARPGYLLINGATRGSIAVTEETRLAIVGAAHGAGVTEGGLSDEEMRARFWRELTYRPEPFAVSPALRAEIEGAAYGLETKSVLVRVDLNTDGQDEYVLVHRNGDNVWAAWFRHDSGEWRGEPIQVSMPARPVDLQTAPIEIRASEFSDLKIGDVLLELAQPD